ncbi:MAG: ABC transporter ATP-binding protein [Defluviitaleaceae bacterium]|nr:ABC transporter ATP-binding protein [Defluviitaleaceae bacterium]
MTKMIEIENLQKNYGDIAAVKNVNISVNEGVLFAFLGTNGAGKTTTIDILNTFLKPNGGRVVINGYELGKQDDKIRSSIGMVFQHTYLDWQLTVEENLRYRAGFYKINIKEAVDRVVKICNLSDIINRRFENLSGGQKRRAEVARALLNTPRLLFLDEPTTGLDPQARADLWATLRNLQKEGMTIFLTTHYMEEAADADYISIIKKGEIITEGTPTYLREKYTKDKLIVNHTNDKTEVLNLDSKQALEYLNSLTTMQSFEYVRGTLDDMFMEVNKDDTLS